MKRTTNWLSRCAVIVVGMSICQGCATDYENSGSPQSLQNPATLTQQGQFTKAAILRGLHDSSLFDVKESVRETGMETQNLPVSKPSPLPVRLSPETGQSILHDEKWHRELGRSFFVRGNYEASAAAYRQALRQNQDVAEAYVGLGSALRMQGQISEAINAYEQALQVEPDSTAALVHLGSMYADAQTEHQDIERAKDLFRHASQQGDPFAKIALQELDTRS
ncbi:MAG: hypothetical protein NPIRA04_30210 [Nitrospirales bacterium]|nr:MAG: hypothetical protein NPIRA04_30210 [Nitrospirales bacterium]